MPWGPGPGSVPFPCEMAVLEGSPKEPGLFTIRIRTTEPWVMPPHTHPRAERVTVLSGTIHVGFGEEVDRAASQTFTTGDYYVNAPFATHFVWADGRSRSRSRVWGRGRSTRSRNSYGSPRSDSMRQRSASRRQIDTKRPA